ncbi:MAG: allophanate hydrolase subunit 1 [Pseudomonadota bacterium]
MSDRAPTFLYLAEDAIGVMVTDCRRARAVAARLAERAPWLEATQGMNSVCVQFDPLQTKEADVVSALAEAMNAPLDEDESVAPLRLKVRYGGEEGPDLKVICGSLGLSADEFIHLHAASAHVVEMIGFMPGFAYLSGLDPALNVARLTTPRPRVAAGSIGISGGYSGAYALASPGGWPIIGRAAAPLFDPSAETPLVLAPGMRVAFSPA